MRVKIIFGGQEVPLLIRWKHIQMPKGQKIKIHETGRKIKGITDCYIEGVAPHPIQHTAFCSEQDTFCKFTGRKVSLTKALQSSPLAKEQRKTIWNQFLIENKKYIQ